jgi:hypothetical protein
VQCQIGTNLKCVLGLESERGQVFGHMNLSKVFSSLSNSYQKYWVFLHLSQNTKHLQSNRILNVFFALFLEFFEVNKHI